MVQAAQLHALLIRHGVEASRAPGAPVSRARMKTRRIHQNTIANTATAPRISTIHGTRAKNSTAAVVTAGSDAITVVWER